MNFCAGMKISLRHENWGELAPVWLATAWQFVVVSCKRIQSHKREPGWTRAGWKSPWYHVNTTLGSVNWLRLYFCPVWNDEWNICLQNVTTFKTIPDTGWRESEQTAEEIPASGTAEDYQKGTWIGEGGQGCSRREVPWEDKGPECAQSRWRSDWGRAK